MGEDKDDSSTGHVAVLVAGTTVAVTLGLMAPFVVLKTPLPYMATPGRKVSNALQFLAKPKNHLFVDLGSGDGEAVYQAAKCGYNAIGYELNWTLWTFSMIRRSTWPSSIRQRTAFYRQDFFRSSLPSDTSVVMVFGVNPLMEPLSRKLSAECCDGAHILSYRFWLPTHKEEGDKLLRAQVVYDVEDMHIYEIGNSEEIQQRDA